MVPKEWDLKALGEIAQITSGGTPSRDKSEYWLNGTVPWIRTTEVQNCILNFEDTVEFITELGLQKSSAKLMPQGTILLAMIGQGKTRGQVALLNFSASTNQNCAAIILKNGHHAGFYFYFLLSQYENIRALSNSAGQSNLTGALVKSIQIPVPPLLEQKKIAQILSTWDQAIATTEHLLDLAGQQKKALMQQLLTGKKRFPGFEGEWTSSDLKKLVTISKGQQLNRDTLDVSGQFPVINGGITQSGFTDQGNCKGNTITISEGGNSCGYVALQKNEFWCGGHCYALTDLKISVAYLYQLLKFNENRIMRLRVGSGLPNIQKKDLEALIVSFPVDSTEQNKIAKLLAAADQEVETLQSQLDGLKQEKKALMQALLTGKRRVQS